MTVTVFAAAVLSTDVHPLNKNHLFSLSILGASTFKQFTSRLDLWCLWLAQVYTENLALKQIGWIWFISYQRLLIRLIGPWGSDKYSPEDLELLLWISMLIGFRLDLTELASPWRGTASSQGEGFCMGVSSGKEEGEREEKRESGFKKKRRRRRSPYRRVERGRLLWWRFWHRGVDVEDITN